MTSPVTLLAIDDGAMLGTIRVARFVVAAPGAPARASDPGALLSARKTG
jgi:hypothetical protein